MEAPEYYTDFNLDANVLKSEQVLREMGLVRLISESVNILYKNSELTENELSIIKALFMQGLGRTTREAVILRENKDGFYLLYSGIVFLRLKSGLNPNTPLHLFLQPAYSILKQIHLDILKVWVYNNITI